MKQFQNPPSLFVSQTEALLDAIHIGFFEAYLESTSIKEAISNQSKNIRIDVNIPNPGTGILKLKTSKMEWETTCKKDCQGYPKGIPPDYSVAFQESDFNLLLSQPNCSGVRFFPGTIKMADGNAQPTLIAVGVRPNGFDIGDGVGYLRGTAFNSTLVE